MSKLTKPLSPIEISQHDATQRLPAINGRIESGNVKFGNDWTGAFIRGDEALVYANAIRCILNAIEPPPEMRSKFVTLSALHDTLEDVWEDRQ